MGEKLNNTTARLIKFKLQGFLFHGSNDSYIKEFEPRLPEGTDPKQGNFNYDKAVFASDNPGSTILFAIIDRSKLPQEIRKGTWSIKWLKDNKSKAIIPDKWKEFLKLAKGYVYVLPTDTFKDELHGQYKSKVSVKPIKKITVKLSDYEELGGTIRWS